jgi:hypothetical protein
VSLFLFSQIFPEKKSGEICILMGRKPYFLKRRVPNKRKAYGEWPDLSLIGGREGVSCW